MSAEYDDLGFVIDLETETCTFDGGFVCPITNILDEDGDEVIDKKDAAYVIVKVPPDGCAVTIDLEALRDQNLDRPTSH